jgi:hypothetical protein
MNTLKFNVKFDNFIYNPKGYVSKFAKTLSFESSNWEKSGLLTSFYIMHAQYVIIIM